MKLRIGALLIIAALTLCALLASYQHKPFETRIDAQSPGVWPKYADLSGLSVARQVTTIPAPKKMEAPADPVARAKFPGEDTQMVDALAYANMVVNNVILPMGDAEHYGKADKMVSWPDDLQGDCEDYALSKLVMLSDAQFPIAERARLRFVYDSNGSPHAVLEVRLLNGAIAVLDNQHDELMTRPELEAEGFKFFDW